MNKAMVKKDWKHTAAILTAIAVFLVSMQNSKEGFLPNGGSVWLSLMGYALAAAATTAELMVTSEFRKLNFTIIALGLAGYTYSIWTNILGMIDLRGGGFDVVNVVTGFFIDVYPEAAIAWALGNSKMGDLIGNLINTVQKPEELTRQEKNAQTINTLRGRIPTNYTASRPIEPEVPMFPGYEE